MSLWFVSQILWYSFFSCAVLKVFVNCLWRKISPFFKWSFESMMRHVAYWSILPTSFLILLSPWISTSSSYFSVGQIFKKCGNCNDCKMFQIHINTSCKEKFKCREQQFFCTFITILRSAIFQGRICSTMDDLHDKVAMKLE